MQLYIRSLSYPSHVTVLRFHAAICNLIHMRVHLAAALQASSFTIMLLS